MYLALQWIKDTGLYESYHKRSDQWRVKLAETSLTAKEKESLVCRTEFQEIYELPGDEEKSRPLGIKDFNLLVQFTGMMYMVATAVFVLEIIWKDMLGPWIRINGKLILHDLRCLLPQLLRPIKGPLRVKPIKLRKMSSEKYSITND